ncbi:MAG: HAMP domain-containing sensor histidine kinase [Myxococcota bacterium]
MSLRAKLAITLALTVLPVTLGTYVLGSRLRRMQEAERLEQTLVEQGEGLQPLCELASSGHRRGRRALRRRRRVRFYDANYESSFGRPAALDPELVAQLEVGDRARVLGDEHFRLAARIGEGPCSIVALDRRAPPRIRPLFALLPGLLAAAIALFSAGPVVRRIRRIRRALESEGELVKAGGGSKDELDELAAAIAADRQTLKDQLETIAARERTLGEYVASTMHDVMIPLTVLQGHLSRLAKGDERPELRSALEESHYIASLLQNLSAAARLEGAIELSDVPVDLSAIGARVVERHRPIARARGLELNVAVAPGLSRAGDPTLLEQAMSNLLHNAVRYAEGRVAVILEETSAGFRFEVIDDGPGVPEEQRARLGERRFRSDEARKRAPTGQGLGLSIAADVAQRHGLSLRFDEGPDGQGLRAGLYS